MNLEWRKALRESRVDSTAKLIGFVLDTYADRYGHCFPSRQTIANGASCDVRTVDQALRRLESRGFVRVRRTKGRDVNRYWLLSPNSERDSLLTTANAERGVTPRTSTAARRRRYGESDDAVTANVDALNGDARSPEAGSKPPMNQPPNRPSEAAEQSSQNGGKPANALPPEAQDFLRHLDGLSLVGNMR